MRKTIEASQNSCKRYAICSLPRSGSFLLCEMLRSVGLGDPREHLRPPILKFLDRSPEDDFDLVEWYQRVNSLARKNGVFGTKLISHFIFGAIPHLNTREQDFFRAEMEQTPIIYLYRRNKLMQALSTQRALVTGIYKVRDDSALETFRGTGWDFDFEEILRLLKVMHRQETGFYRALKNWGSRVKQVSYERLCEDMNGAVAEISRHIGVLPEGAVHVAENMMTRDELSHEYADRFITEYSRRFGDEPKQFFDPESCANTK